MHLTKVRWKESLIKIRTQNGNKAYRIGIISVRKRLEAASPWTQEKKGLFKDEHLLQREPGREKDIYKETRHKYI